jgi:hypothetical protein
MTRKNGTYFCGRIMRQNKGLRAWRDLDPNVGFQAGAPTSGIGGTHECYLDVAPYVTRPAVCDIGDENVSQWRRIERAFFNPS